MLGRSGRSGAAPDVAGLVVVMAVEATGLPATGVDDNALPARDSSQMVVSMAKEPQRGST